MKKIIIVMIILILSIIFYVIFRHKEYGYTPIMYEICDDDSCIYLLGSMHLGDDRINKLSNIVRKAYSKSDKIAVELNVNSVNINISDYIDTNNEISEELNNKLIDFSNNHILFPYDVLKNMKLGYIYDYISLLPYLENGYNTEGLDNYFINLAEEDNKEIIELETYDEQLSLLFGYSNEFYSKQLEEVINNYDDIKDLSIKLYEAYLNSDINELKKLIDEDSISNTEEEERYLKAMYDDRNSKMSKKIEEFLDKDEKVFMIVGCAHVIGNNGIVELLNNKYKISIVK